MSRYLIILVGMVCLAASLANAADSGHSESSEAESRRTFSGEPVLEDFVGEVSPLESKELFELYEQTVTALAELNALPKVTPKISD